MTRVLVQDGIRMTSSDAGAKIIFDAAIYVRDKVALSTPTSLFEISINIGGSCSMQYSDHYDAFMRCCVGSINVAYNSQLNVKPFRFELSGLKPEKKFSHFIMKSLTGHHHTFLV